MARSGGGAVGVVIWAGAEFSCPAPGATGGMLNGGGRDAFSEAGAAARGVSTGPGCGTEAACPTPAPLGWWRLHRSIPCSSPSTASFTSSWPPGSLLRKFCSWPGAGTGPRASSSMRLMPRPVLMRTLALRSTSTPPSAQPRSSASTKRTGAACCCSTASRGLGCTGGSASTVGAAPPIAGCAAGTSAMRGACALAARAARPVPPPPPLAGGRGGGRHSVHRLEAIELAPFWRARPSEQPPLLINARLPP